MSKLLITDIPLFTDISIEQQEIILGGATTGIETNYLPNYIRLDPIINNFLTSLNFNIVDLEKYLNSMGLDIKLPIT
jgi:hypothetical protein